MKKILLSLFALGALTACETIDEGERYENERPFKLQRNVLVEDFTGQNCVNCPAAATLLHNLIETTKGANGEHIVAVSIHGGALAMGIDKSPLGLATDIGEDYNTRFDVQAWPSGMINRTNGKDGKGNWVCNKPCTTDKWITCIAQHGFTAATIDLTANTTFNAETRQLHVDVTAEATEGHSVTADMKLTVWLTESGIEGFQKYSDHNDTKYQHNHVLREALSDPYGDTMTIEANRATVSYSHTIPATYGRNKWAVNPAEMAVVAFVTDKSGEVLQVIDVPVVKQ